MGFFSQHGEDQVLAALFANRSSGVCVEVGAHDGIHLSNTLYFDQLGWRCILVEPNPELCRRILVNRPRAQLFECGASSHAGQISLNIGLGSNDVYSSFESPEKLQDRSGTWLAASVPVRTLDSILEQSGVPDTDFLSIDVEGHELAVLDGLSLQKWKPRVVILEDNSDLTDKTVEARMKEEGYRKFYRSGSNEWYARPDQNRLTLILRVIGSGVMDWKGMIKAWAPRSIIRPLLGMKRKLSAPLEYSRRSA